MQAEPEFSYASAYRHIMTQIDQACERANRPNAPTLIAVSKKQPVRAIQALYELGQRDFGENYLQEALAKQGEMSEADINWHFIGPVQRNKTRELACHFDWVHSVDRLLVAERLAAQRPAGRGPLNICLQVNIDEEEGKSGCRPQQAAGLVAAISQLGGIRLRGLMVIPHPEQTDAFIRTAALFQQLRASHAHPDDWDTLSMGMSADFPAAIASGASFIRVGTALFGERSAAAGGIL